MRFVDLSEEEKLKLEDLYKNSDSHVTRERCLCLLLSSKRHSMKDISRITGINWLKIVRLFNHWQQADDKYSSLSIASGRGAKVKLSSVKAILPELVDKYARNLTPILEELQGQHNISVCKLTLQNFLKDLGL